MSNRSVEVDAYIAKTPEYAKPILVKIRELYHTACPDVTESIKWSRPFFEYEGILGNMSAFKNYVRMSFWKTISMSDPHNIFSSDAEAGALQVTNAADLPSDEILIAYIREAVALNKAGIDIARQVPKKEPTSFEAPDDLQAALSENAESAANFESFSPSKRREYVEWIVGAKQDATRAKRIATAVAQIAEGKALNWKYEKR